MTSKNSYYSSRRDPPPDAPTLPELLTMYNAMLGWSQYDLAEAVKRDSAVINRIFKGHSRRPHQDTLEAIALAYQRAGLSGVTVEQLLTARDRPQQGYDNPFGIPPQWLRLVRSVLAMDEAVQDSFFRKWSMDLAETAQLLAKRLPQDSDDEIDE